MKANTILRNMIYSAVNNMITAPNKASLDEAYERCQVMAREIYLAIFRELETQKPAEKEKHHE